MGWLPPELTNQSFQDWLNRDKAIDRRITWTSEIPRMDLTPVDVLNDMFTEPTPKLTGWANRYGFSVGVLYEGKIWLVRADLKGHVPTYHDPCSNELIGIQAHIHWFNESCPGWQVRRLFPPQMTALGNNPAGVLAELLKLIKIRHRGIDPANVPARLQGRIGV